MLTLFAQSGFALIDGSVVPIVGIVAGCSVGAIAIVMGIRKAQKEHEDRAVLLQQMLDRGMSPDEIAKLFASAFEAGRKNRC